MRAFLVLIFLLATPALAQDDAPRFFERLFGTDSAETDAEQGSLLEQLIEDSLSGAGRSVSITGFQGALSGAASLQTLTISDADGPWLTLTDATLNWNRAALFAGRLEVTTLTAAEIQLPRLPQGTEQDAPSPEARPFQLPDLPVSVDIGQIAAARVSLGEDVLGVAAEIALDGSLSLADGQGSAALAINRLDQIGEIALDAAYENTTQNLRIDLKVVEGEGGILGTLAGLPGTPSVDFSINGDAPLSEFKADIRLATDGAERFAGSVILGDTPAARTINAQIAGNIAPVFAPEYREFLGDNLTFETEAFLFKDGRISLREFSLFAREMALFGRVELGADRMPRLIDVTGRLAPDTGETVLLPFSDGEAEVARANFAVQFDAAKSEDWLSVIRLENLTTEGVEVGEIALRTTGRISTGVAARVSGDLDFSLSDLAGNAGLVQAVGTEITGSARVDWDGDAAVDVTDFALTARALSATGTARLAAGQVALQSKLNAARIANFATLAGRDLSGQATLEIDLEGNPLAREFALDAQGTTLDLAVGDPRADAILAGEARLNLAVKRDDEGIRLTLPTLESAAASLTGEASLRSGGSTVSLRGKLNETALVLPGLSGPSDISLSGIEDETRDWTIAANLTARQLTGEVSGLLGNLYDLPTFQGKMSASAPDLSVFSETAGRALAGQLAFVAEGGTNADFSRALVSAKVTGQDITVDGLGVNRLLQGPVRLDFEGARTEDRIDIKRAQFQGQSLEALISGAVTGLSATPRFEGAVTAKSPDLSVFANLANRALGGSLDLTAEGAVTADLGEARIKATATGQNVSVGIRDADALLRGPLSLTLDAERSNDRVAVADLSIRTGSFRAETSGQLGKEGDRLGIEARLNDLAPFVPGISGPLTVNGSVGANGSDLALDLNATGPGGARATVNGSLAQDASTANLRIAGNASLALANRIIAPRNLTGASQFDLRLSGPPALQSLSGRITIADARLATPNLGTPLSDISGRIDLADGRAAITLDAGVDSGGRIAVTGPVGLAPPNAATLRIDLQDVRLIDPKLYETFLDGQVRVDGPLAGGASIGGAVTLGETNIRIPSSGIGGTGAIPEITHLNEPPPVRGTRARAGLLDRNGDGGAGGGATYPLDLRVTAPNRIFVRGRGLDSEFGGALRITGTTQNVIPIGAFQLIRGRLDILGRRLALEEARITIQGDLIPFLNIRATTDAEDTTVNVEVIGPADSPEIRFTSAPELPQEEVLSRLIFGRGLETLSPLQAARLALAIRRLAGQGGEGIVGNIRGRTGLADLDVTTNEEGNAAVRAGAYLGENVYSDVTVDSAGETQLNLNLDVSPSLTVRGGVTNEGTSSLGIFFERDY